MIGSVHLFVMVLFTSTSLCATRHFTLIADEQFGAPDGMVQLILSYHLKGSTNQNPEVLDLPVGPTLLVERGDTVNVLVENHMMDRTLSTHFHGMFQHDTPWADGVAQVSQCAQLPGSTWNYQFRVPDQEGSYWYHSHVGVQYGQGLWGSFIILPPGTLSKTGGKLPPNERIINFQGWYDEIHSKLFARARWNKVGTPEVKGPAYRNPQAVLVNGLGRSLDNASLCHTHGLSACPYSVTQVTQGSSYKLRLISSASILPFEVSIDNHRMTIVAIDGVEVIPYTVDYLWLFTAQRYDVTVEMNQAVDNYWIRGYAVKTFDGQPGRGATLGFGILRYDGAPATDPTTKPPTKPGVGLKLNDNVVLHPLVASPPPVATHLIIWDINVVRKTAKGAKTFFFTLNNVSFSLPTAPVLQQAYHNLPYGPGVNVQELEDGAVYDLVFQNPGSQGVAHPFHLHGHVFWVTGKGNGTYVHGKSPLNEHNPPLRDTCAMLPGHSWMAIRIRADNPGAWIIHCHIEPHLAFGLGIVLVEAKGRIPAPPERTPICGQGPSFTH